MTKSLVYSNTTWIWWEYIYTYLVFVTHQILYFGEPHLIFYCKTLCFWLSVTYRKGLLRYISHQLCLGRVLSLQTYFWKSIVSITPQNVIIWYFFTIFVYFGMFLTECDLHIGYYRVFRAKCVRVVLYLWKHTFSTL